MIKIYIIHNNVIINIYLKFTVAKTKFFGDCKFSPLFCRFKNNWAASTVDAFVNVP